jgi:hypothetical protein
MEAVDAGSHRTAEDALHVFLFKRCDKKVRSFGLA